MLRRLFIFLCLLFTIQLVKAAPSIDTFRIKKLIDSANQLYNTGKYAQSVELAETIKQYSTAVKFNKGLAQAHLVISSSLFRMGNFSKANDEAIESLKISEKYNLYKHTVSSYLMLANIKMSSNDMINAKKQFLQAIAVANSNKFYIGVARVCTNLAVLFKKEKMYDSAELYMNKAKEVFINNKDSLNLAVLYNNYVSLYIQQEQINLALDYCKKSESLANTLKDRMLLASIKINFGEIYLQQKDFINAEKCLLAALALRKEVQVPIQIGNCHKLLSSLYEKQKNYKAALTHHIIFKEISDSLSNIEKAQAIAFSNTIFETEKKDKSIALLNKEKQLQQQQLQASQKRQQLFTIIFIVGLVVLSGVFLLAMNNFKQRQQTKISQIDKEKIQSELRGLKSQLNPHVLFNSLNTIYFQIDENADDAKETILKYAEILRYQLYQSNEDFIDIETEIEYLNKFIDIQKLRLSDRCTLTVEIDQTFKKEKIAPLLIITIVENAFKHATNNIKGIDNFIYISLQKSNNKLELKTRNSILMGEEPKKDNKQGGIGLKNLVKRLDLIYADKYSLLYGPKDNVFSVDLTLTIC